MCWTQTNTLHSALKWRVFSTVVIVWEQQCYFQGGKPLCPDSWDHDRSDRPLSFQSFLYSPVQLMFKSSQIQSLPKTQISNRRHLESHMLSYVAVEWVLERRNMAEPYWEEGIDHSPSTGFVVGYKIKDFCYFPCRSWGAITGFEAGKQINQSPLCWQCESWNWEGWGEKLQVGHRWEKKRVWLEQWQ